MPEDYARFGGAERNETARHHPSGHGCFYAAIEVRDRPSLRGKPVGVGGARDRRGVLTTCNYEARKFGVRSAMPTFMAFATLPESDCPTDAFRCLSPRGRDDSRNLAIDSHR